MLRQIKWMVMGWGLVFVIVLGGFYLVQRTEQESKDCRTQGKRLAYTGVKASSEGGSGLEFKCGPKPPPGAGE